ERRDSVQKGSDAARWTAPPHDDHGQRPDDSRLLRRRLGAEAREEERQLRRPDPLPPVFRRRAGRARLDPFTPPTSCWPEWTSSIASRITATGSSPWMKRRQATGSPTLLVRATSETHSERRRRVMSIATPGFESDIKPLFNERDRGSMRSHFDLWSYDDVSQNADAILQTVSTGSMPCYGQWPSEQVDL